MRAHWRDTDEQAESYGTFTQEPTRPELERFFFLPWPVVVYLAERRCRRRWLRCCRSRWGIAAA
ncbi:hypothetical protein ABZ370_04310 [Streptomyces sp. NPDC005962]|uniref:hypothetical protein n=1 Tax=Streptomyces sp. NPDC005962 TaxID=3154466 RepID=UPI0033DA29EE